QMPRKFFQLAVSGKDTLIDTECYFEIVDHSYSEQSIFAALREVHFNDMAESLIIDLTKDPSGGAFKIICRNSGMLYNGGDYNLVSDQLDRAEQDMEYSTLIFRPLENDKELFYLTRAGVETVWTTSQDKYKNVEL